MKPRIYYRNGMWVCVSNIAYGHGITPQQAYIKYRVNLYTIS